MSYRCKAGMQCGGCISQYQRKVVLLRATRIDTVVSGIFRVRIKMYVSINKAGKTGVTAEIKVNGNISMSLTD